MGKMHFVIPAYKVTAASKLKAAGLESSQVQNEKGLLEQLLTEEKFTFDMCTLPGEPLSGGQDLLQETLQLQ